MVVFALLSVPIATGLAYLPHVIKEIVLMKHNKFDNTKPRGDESVDEKTDQLVTHLSASHNNQLESLGPYAAGVAAATAVGVAPAVLANATATYVGARVAYCIAYMAPQICDGVPRSLSWCGAMGAMIWIWVAAATKNDEEEEED